MSLPALFPERRARQRFPAVRDGKPYVWLLLGDARWPLSDLSLDGFSVAQETPLKPGDTFEFALKLSDAPDKVKGVAEAMSTLGGLTGCRFVSVEGEGEARVFEWLTVIVICAAKLRITAKEAESIVRGPSLI
jgi:hypothetical protein